MAITHSEVYEQALTRINFFSKKEMAELPKLLMPDEKVLAVISGFYTAGTAILCVTDKRLLLVDKKLIRLSFEDVRFESVKEVNYSQQAFMASVKFFYAGREMQFRSWYRNELRMLAQLVQQKMFEVREKSWHPAQSSQKSQNDSPVQVATDPPVNDMYGTNVHMEQYMTERIRRWREATRFVNTLTISTKAGRQILELENRSS